MNDFLAPLSLDTFCEKYFDQKPIHLKGEKNRFSSLFSWKDLNNILENPTLWTSSSLQLVEDGSLIRPEFYCIREQGLFRPHPAKVMEAVRRGASLVCNDISGLTPSLRQVHNYLATTFKGKVQANIYCSWNSKQAFKSHFDTHDVFVFHVEGEKKWHLYEGRFEGAIAHPSFRNFGQDYHEKHKGKIDQDIILEPGDFLYIPRGFYHDALASSQASLHVTFGVTYPIGLDYLSLLFEEAIQSPLWRKNSPIPSNQDLLDLWTSSSFQSKIDTFKSSFPNPYPSFRLPEDQVAFSLSASHVSVTPEGLLKTAKGQVAIPENMIEIVRWIISKPSFSLLEIKECFSNVSLIEEALQDLSSMGVIKKQQLN